MNAFLPQGHDIGTITEDDVKEADIIIRTIDSLCKMTGRPVCIINLQKEKIVYASEGYHSIYEIDVEELCALGYGFFQKNTPEHELEQINRFRYASYGFLLKNEKLRKRMYQIGFNAHLRINDKIRLFRHTIAPLLFTDKGLPWLVMYTLSQPFGRTTKIGTLRWQGENTYHTYNLETGKWAEKELTKLTEREREILRLSAQGCTAKEISEKLYMSVVLVKQYKHNLFRKLDVNNMASAITCGLYHHLI